MKVIWTGGLPHLPGVPHLHVNKPLKSKGLFSLTRWVTIGLTAAVSGAFYTTRRRSELPSNFEGNSYIYCCPLIVHQIHEKGHCYKE